ncbi:hypothetical protein KKF84_15820 [Myxococcota bacterium]|nr:hypothetical protein [Myxococcota bacterium]
MATRKIKVLAEPLRAIARPQAGPPDKGKIFEHPFAPETSLLEESGGNLATWFIPVLFIDENDNGVLDEDESLGGALDIAPGIYYERPSSDASAFGDYWNMAMVTDETPVYLDWDSVSDTAKITVRRGHPSFAEITVTTDATDFSSLRAAFVTFPSDLDAGTNRLPDLSLLTDGLAVVVTDIRISSSTTLSEYLMEPGYFLDATQLTEWAGTMTTWFGYTCDTLPVIPVLYRDLNGDGALDEGDLVVGGMEDDFGTVTRIWGARRISWEEVLNHQTVQGMARGLNYLKRPREETVFALTGDATSMTFTVERELPVQTTPVSFIVVRGDYTVDSVPLASGTLTVPTAGDKMEALCDDCSQLLPGDRVIITESLTQPTHLNWATPLFLKVSQ